MGLETVILKSYTKSIRSTFQFQNLISDLKGKIPSIQNIGDLKGIIGQKNNISNSLSSMSGVLGNLNTLKSSASSTINTLKAATKVIKSLPLPTSTPPGVGIPVSIITTYADSLDGIREFLKENKGQLKTINPVISSIRGLINKTKSELKSLDVQITSKIDESVSAHIDMEIDRALRLDGIEPQNDGDNDAYNTLKLDLKLSDEYVDLALSFKNSILEDLDFVETPTLNLNSLTSNSTNPLIYKNYRLTVQNEREGVFSVPFRRIQGKNLSNNSIIYNSGGDYSFSSSIEILIKEIKYEIDKIS